MCSVLTKPQSSDSRSSASCVPSGAISSTKASRIGLEALEGFGFVPDRSWIGFAPVGSAAEVFEVLADDRGGRSVLSVSKHGELLSFLRREHGGVFRRDMFSGMRARRAVTRGAGRNEMEDPFAPGLTPEHVCHAERVMTE